MDTFPVRDLHFELEPVPRDWHPAGPAVSRHFDALSIFFPAGERFFVQAVKRFAPHAKDPALVEAVRAFCGQEGVHAREHVAYNARLQALGYPAAKLEARTERFLATVVRYAPKRGQLAATCALEHFTGMMADTLLGDPRTLAGADPTMARLWAWHSAEETEHKAVAFDVYRASGSSWLRRCFVMLNTTLIFWALVFDHQLRFMRVDGTLSSPREWWRLFRFLWIAPGGLRRMVVPWLRYFSPRFHPDQHDNRALVAAWRAQLPGTPPR